MKKQQIYVPVANKKEAKRFKAVLESMGEKIKGSYWIDEYGCPQDQLIFDGIAWKICTNTSGLTKITIKQLIEILVSEAQQPTEPEKIAIRVDNEKEFNALIKYYDSLGWVGAGKQKPLHLKFDGDKYVAYHNSFYYTSKSEVIDYKIIPFADFAKEHGIRLPRLTTFDGVDVFNGDTIATVNLKDYSKGNMSFLITEKDTFDGWVGVTHNIFSTKKAAEKWIEEQKPKEVKVTFGNVVATVEKDGVRFNSAIEYITATTLVAMYTSMEELKS